MGNLGNCKWPNCECKTEAGEPCKYDDPDFHIRKAEKTLAEERKKHEPKEEVKLDLILADDEKGKKRLWACRGEGKGCNRNKFRTSKKPCVDCMGPLDEKLTLEQVTEKLKQGDA